MWLHSQAVKTPASHAGDESSILSGVIRQIATSPGSLVVRTEDFHSSSQGSIPCLVT